MAYWLLKSEPTSYSINDLAREKQTIWDGVRNYQARNLLRDEVRKGDMVLFYHSSTEPIGIAGIAEVVRNAYPDPTQFDTKDHHYDPKSKKENPQWVCVDVGFKRKFKRIMTLSELKNDPFFNDMVLTQKGSRLSVQPVQKKHFDRIMELVGSLS
jgi:predicted RNA-binding protein with PUA-like domain